MTDEQEPRRPGLGLPSQNADGILTKKKTPQWITLVTYAQELQDAARPIARKHFAGEEIEKYELDLLSATLKLSLLPDEKI